MAAVCLSVKNNGAFYKMKATDTPKVRVEPRLSGNKLGEYLVAKPKRRRRILTDSKYPKSFIGPRFGDFYKILEKGIQEDSIDTDSLDAAIQILVDKTTSTDWHAQNKTLSLDLLSHLKIMVDSMGLNQYSVKKLVAKPGVSIVRGVEISVRPELLIEAEKRGEKVIGAVKLNVAKSFPLNDDSGNYIATMVRNFLEEQYSGDVSIDPSLCFVVDLPHERFFKAPKAFKQRTADIEAACDEIRAVWPTIS